MEKRLRNAIKRITIDPITTLIKVDQHIVPFYFKKYAPAAAAVADVDRIVTSANMKNTTTYTIANASSADSLCRNVTMDVATVGGVADTMGTILVTGTDYNDEVITETFTPVSGAQVVGVRAFKTVTAAVGTGWARDGAGGTEDTIEIGYGNVVGMPEIITKGDIVMTIWNQAMSTTLPTFTYSNEISKCTVTLPAAGDSAKKLIVFYIKYTGH
jgi:hypothetical protein